jgi:major type 1 subunit fimbrin (pilin)
MTIYLRRALTQFTLLAAAAVLLMSAAHAVTCIKTDGWQSENVLNLPGNITAPVDTPIGKTMGSNSISGFGSVTCDSEVMAYYSVHGTAAPGFSDGTITTNIPGIGLRFFYEIPPNRTYPFLTVRTTGSSFGPSWVYGFLNSFIGVEIVKIGEIESGTYDGSAYATIELDDQLVLRVNISPFSIVAGTCTVPSVSVPLGTHYTKEFSGGVGATTQAVGFDLSLKNCAKNMAHVYYQIDPATAYASNTDGSVVTLDGASLATGVGVQLLDGNGTPFKLGMQKDAAGIYYNPGLGGDFTIPLQARYYQTGSVIGGGSANAAMKVTFTYM